MASIRGKVLKVPDVTPGLLFVNGQQRSFEINGIWQSTTVAPSGDMTVDVQFDDSGAISAVRPVTDSDLAKEQAKKAVDAAGEKGKQLASFAVAEVGKPVLIAVALLILSWFFLDYYSVRFSGLFMNVTVHPTFWRQIGYLHVVQDDLDNLVQLVGDINRYSGPHSDMPPMGIYGILGAIALVGPLLPIGWKDKRAHLGALLPFLFTLLIFAQNLHATYAIQKAAREAVTQTVTGLSNLYGGDTANAQATAQINTAAQKAIDQQTEQFKQALHWSLGPGFYLSTLSVLYLAWAGGMKYLAFKAKEG
jgi:hypothetical protein